MGFAHKRRALPKRIRLDYETYSEMDLTACGTWRYAEDPSTRVLVATFEIDGQLLVWCPDDRFRRVPPHVSFICRDRTFPKMILNALADGYRLVATNAEFEYAITKLVCGVKIEPHQMECTAACQVYFHLPRNLHYAAKTLGFKGKDDRGDALIAKFSVPQPEDKAPKPTKNKPLAYSGKARRHQVTGQETLFTADEINEPEEIVDLFGTAAAVERGLTFDDLVSYNVQDVEQTVLIDNKVGPWWPEQEVRVWQHTLKMNERGLLLDMQYLMNIQRIQKEAPTEVVIENRKYRYEDFASPAKAKAILAANGYQIDSLNKNVIENLLAAPKTPPFVRKILELRRDASRVSLAKLEIFKDYVSYDGYLRGNYVYGGTDTLRWASWGCQLQNLPKPDKGIDSKKCAVAIEARSLPMTIEAGDGYHNRALVAGLSGLITAGKGNVFLKSDFSQIEARFVLWLADDHEHLDWWRKGRDMYCEMATKLFGREIKKGRDDKERDIGKRLILACNFQLGGDKFEKVEAPKYGIDLKAMNLTGEECVSSFRNEFVLLSAKRTGLWDRLERAMRDVVSYGGEIREAHLVFRKVGSAVWVELPSGRDFVFRNCRIGPFTKYKGTDHEQLVPDALIHTVEIRKGTSVDEDLYGGKLADLFTQASCRDLQALKMLELEEAGLPVCAQVHDEATTKCAAEDAPAKLKLQEAIMTKAPTWCADFPIAVDSKVSMRYLK